MARRGAGFESWQGALLDMSSRCLWTVFVTSALLMTVTHRVATISLAPISWNTSNPMFKTSKNDHLIEVKLYDDIDFVCPYSSGLPHDSHHNEYYIIYMVGKMEYDDCNVYSENTAVMMLNCSNPQQRKRFTILFEPFQSIPNVPEYHPGGTYYFITTSTGSQPGIGNLYQGACASRNMKLTVRVCCETSTPKFVKQIVSNTVAEPKLDHHHRPASEKHHPKHNHKTPLREDFYLSMTSTVLPTTVKSTHPSTTRRAYHLSKTRTEPVVVKTIDKDPMEFDIGYEMSNRIEDISNAKHEGLVDSTTSLAPSTIVMLCCWFLFGHVYRLRR